MTEKKTAAKDKKDSKPEASLKELAEKNSSNKKTSDKTEHTVPDSEKSQQTSSPSNFIPYLLIMVVLAVSAGGLYLLWQKQQQDLNRQQTSLQNIKQQIIMK